MIFAKSNNENSIGNWPVNYNKKYAIPGTPYSNVRPFYVYDIYRTGLPPSERNPAFLQAVFACSEHTCWRKTNNYCTALKGGRIWFVKGIIVCFNTSPADFHLLHFLFILCFIFTLFSYIFAFRYSIFLSIL